MNKVLVRGLFIVAALSLNTIFSGYTVNATEVEKSSSTVESNKESSSLIEETETIDSSQKESISEGEPTTQPSQVEETTESSQIKEKRMINGYSEDQYNAEKEKALQAGFTEEQFDQIMNMPQIPEANSGIATRAALTGDQSKVVSKAKEQIGKPYVWGASGPSSFDCGGLVKYVYKQAVNIELPMGTFNQEKYGKEVSLNSLLPGDLLFYGTRGNTYHVGIYIGNNQMIHAPQPGQNVTTVDIKYFYPSFARRILSTTDPAIQKTFSEVSKTVMINKENKTIDTLPWGMKGYSRLGNSPQYLGNVVSITQDSGSYAYSPELKGWIDKKGITEVIKTNCSGKIVNSGYQINPVPWYSGVQVLGDSKDHIGKQVTVSARNGSYYYVANLGWIDKKAFSSDLQKAVDGTPNSNQVTNNKFVVTETDISGTINNVEKEIDTLPWGQKGYVKLGTTKSMQGKTVKITQDNGSYIYSPDLKGWVDKKGLTIK